MSQQITWTHVDKYVREMHDHRGMLETGMTDAEVTLSYIKFIERQLQKAEDALIRKDDDIQRTRVELEAVKTRAMQPGKTKQRLAALEIAVQELRLHTGLHE